MKRLIITILAAFALATGNAHADVFENLTTFKVAHSANPAAFRAIVAQGGPSFEQTKAAVIEYIERRWKDPDSAKAIGVAFPVYNTRATVHKDWIIVFEANGKNSFGAYIGVQRYVICWKNGAIDYKAQLDLEGWNAFRQGMMEGLE